MPILRKGRSIVRTIDRGILDYGPLNGLSRVLSPENLFRPGPVPSLALAGAGTGALGNETSFNITFGSGSIQIDAGGSDARELATNLSRHIGESMRAVVEQLDSKVIA